MLSTTNNTMILITSIFIDSTVSDYQTLAASVMPGIATVILNSHTDETVLPK